MKIFENKKKLHIAMLGQKKVPSREGGIEVVVQELSTRMVKLGHEVTCLNRHEKGNEKMIKEYQGVKIKTLFNIDGRGWSAMTSSISGAIVAAFGKYDIVHFHAEGICTFLWLTRLFGKRCIVTIHGLDHMREKWGWLASKFIKWGEKYAAKYAAEIIVLSENNQRYFKEVYNREVKFIPNGVNAPQKRKINILANKEGITENGYILFVGRIVPEKGIKYLVKAFEGVKTDKKLVFLGGVDEADSFTAEFRKIIKRDKRIIHMGFMQGEELDEVYSNAYVYVLPSDLEGMSISLLESMSYGNCCVVSDIPECTEVVEDKAMTFKKGNIEELRECLQKLCDNPKIVESYKEKSAEFICSKYNWNEVVAQTISLYRGDV